MKICKSNGYKMARLPIYFPPQSQMHEPVIPTL